MLSTALSFQEKFLFHLASIMGHNFKIYLFLNLPLQFPTLPFISGDTQAVFTLCQRAAAKVEFNSSPRCFKLHGAIFGIVYIKYPYHLLIFFPTWMFWHQVTLKPATWGFHIEGLGAALC